MREKQCLFDLNIRTDLSSVKILVPQVIKKIAT